MILTTTPTIEGKRILEYKGIVFGEAAFGSGIVKELTALVAGFTGKRVGTYETKLDETRVAALAELTERARALGANAVVGVDVDYEQFTGLLMISASGTAVVVG
jgi:uncharacterized protein YbjQ (UPF0145 family)